MGWIKRCGIWLSRIGHAQGFGIQSPHDFRFVREVIGEKWPYYSYEVIGRRCLGAGRRTERLARLYFRIANYAQPPCIVSLLPDSDLWDTCLHMGCRKARRVTVADSAAFSSLPLEDRCLIWVDAGHIDSLLPRLHEISSDSVMIVHGISRDEVTANHWRQLAQRSEVRLVFDLYHCGILFFDKNRYKQYYTINY